MDSGDDPGHMRNRDRFSSVIALRSGAKGWEENPTNSVRIGNFDPFYAFLPRPSKAAVPASRCRAASYSSTPLGRRAPSGPLSPASTTTANRREGRDRRYCEGLDLLREMAEGETLSPAIRDVLLVSVAAARDCPPSKR